MDEALDLLVQTGYRKSVAYLTLGDVPSVSNALVEYCLVKVNCLGSTPNQRCQARPARK